MRNASDIGRLLSVVAKQYDVNVFNKVSRDFFTKYDGKHFDAKFLDNPKEYYRKEHETFARYLSLYYPRTRYDVKEIMEDYQ